MSPLIDVVASSRKSFFFFVQVCNEEYRSGHDLSQYREIIDYHKEYEDIYALLSNDDFVRLVRKTLAAWNMDQRGARLESLTVLQSSIREYEDTIYELSRYKMTEMDSVKSDVIDMLQEVFLNLAVMETDSRFVGVSKCMHFLLPDLVPPMDREYTIPYVFGVLSKYSKKPDKEFEYFMQVFEKYHAIVRDLDLSDSDVSGEQWNTSVPKLIDNAIIGFDKYSDGRSREEINQMLRSL